jgi:long-chain acyl-CoA synthetase
MQRTGIGAALVCEGGPVDAGQPKMLPRHAACPPDDVGSLMGYPGTIAAIDPDRPAVVMGASGDIVTYGQLNDGSIRLARLLRESGLQRGDHFAVMMENHPRYCEVVWAAMRSGLYVTAINSHLTPSEAAFIVDDCGATVLVTSAARAGVARAMVTETPGVLRRLMVDGEITGHESYKEATAAYATEPLDEEQRGTVMLYSSGTTGRPKGVKFPLPTGAASLGEAEIAAYNQALYGFRDGMVYLSPAPLYHAAPLRVTLAVQSLGGTVVVMERFDPEQALRLIARERVTHSQWVPTMFVRMLKLPVAARTQWDLSSHEVAIHAAAPCSIETKEQMIAWWGPILEEYYAGTENIGSTRISSEEWLTHKGSVGRAGQGAVVHICDDAGDPLPPGEDGTVYFELPGAEFVYHHDAEKTKTTSHPDHPTWRTLGDIGRLDAEGYLYLTDRKAFMIVAGGVNIYPQEIEDVLLAHPDVLDAAVFGVPNPEMGEEVKAVIQPVDFQAAGDHMTANLRTWCEERLAGFKRPRTYDYVEQLPRLDNGKLYKRELRDRFWEGRESRVI